MTTEEARKCREFAEHVILTALQTLTKDTGLDITEVKVYSYVEATTEGEPIRRVRSVRIDLCV